VSYSGVGHIHVIAAFLEMISMDQTSLKQYSCAAAITHGGAFLLADGTSWQEVRPELLVDKG